MNSKQHSAISARQKRTRTLRSLKTALRNPLLLKAIATPPNKRRVRARVKSIIGSTRTIRPKKKPSRTKTSVIKLPHINYTVVVEHKKKGDLDGAAAYTRHVSPDESLICLKLPIKGPITAGHLVHEIMHVLQNIHEDRHMSFAHEREHMAYIAGYLFEQISKL